MKRTPLYHLHVELGARFCPFAGYEMPIQFKEGILREHGHTRAAASLFDVSHMGQIAVRPNSGRVIDAAHALEALVPADIVNLPEGQQRYSLFTNDRGGILDDLMIANRGDHLLLVVNAACKDADEQLLRQALSDRCIVELLPDRALLALQGPGAEEALERIAPEIAGMRFMNVRDVSILGTAGVVSRSGYTGEDGFEIGVPAGSAEKIARELLARGGVAPAGLGARDSLRLEAGLCLYGVDIDTTTTPVEAALDWSIQKARRKGGARAGGFPGDQIVLRELDAGARRRRVGLRPEDRTPVRGGSPLYADEDSAAAIGQVTSGTFGPSVNGPVAMGYVAASQSSLGSRLFAEVRGKRVPMRVSGLPFVPARFKR